MGRDGVEEWGEASVSGGRGQGRMFRVTVQDRWESVGTVTLANQS